MRIFLPAIAIVIVHAGPSSAATRNFGIESFERIRVDGPYRVRLQTGVAPYARASGNAAALDRVSVTLQGKTLIVRTSQSSWGNFPGEQSGPVEIELGTHELSAAWLNGAGGLAIDKVKGLSFDLSVQGSGLARIAAVEVDQLKVAVAGTASAALAGNAATMNAAIRGTSMLDAGALSVKDATIAADGPATVRAAISNAAKIEAAGLATIELAGQPSCTSRVTGSANVYGCR
jgi:hypothetical protein